MSKRAKEAELIKRRKQVRMLFRALIRMVIFNKSWLQDIEEQKISTNIKKNIAMLVRQERKIGILTMAEKALIRTPVWMRTIEDRKKLVNLMLNLTCFAKFPPKIRARLSTVVKFIYLNPGRTIIKEDCDPVAVYFILTGEVEVTRMIFNPDKEKYDEKLDFISGPGDCIGEIELIEHCLRQQTCKATNDVELLTVYEDDFDRILRPFMEKQWEEKKIALAAFDYFKDWNLHQIVYACKVGLLKQYEPLETIYYEDKGPLSHVHFVISGQCMILQCLKMKVTEKGKNKSFSLLDIQDGESSMLFSNLTNEEILKKLNEAKVEGRVAVATDVDDVSVRSSMDSEEDQQPEEEVAGVYRKARKSDYKKYALMCGVDLSIPDSIIEKKDSNPVLEEASINRLSNKSEVNTQRRSTTLTTSIEEQSTTKLESHFIDVGSLTYGGIFGLGEQLEHRVIMARTTVQCLLIPRFWLLEKDQNPGNIWQRMRFYLNSTIPSRELLFQDFLATRKWQQFKKKLIAETLDTTKVGNPTKVQDIPIICRIVEANDDDDKFNSDGR